MRSLIPLALLACLTGCASTPPEDDPVQVKLNDIDARLTRVERIVTNQSLVELAQHLDEVQTAVRQLRGRMDELENSSEATRKQQRDLYNDLDKRLTALGSGSGSSSPGSAAAGAAVGAAAGSAAGAAAGSAGGSGGGSSPQS